MLPYSCEFLEPHGRIEVYELGPGLTVGAWLSALVVSDVIRLRFLPCHRYSIQECLLCGLAETPAP